jgi:hypothetical protein
MVTAKVFPRLPAIPVRAILVAALIGGWTTLCTPVASAAEKSFSCTPVDVAAFPKSRVHVRCSPGDGAIAFFALGLTNQDDANRVLSVAATALAAKKKLLIFYDPNDLSGSNIGCLTSDCRLIRGIQMF